MVGMTQMAAPFSPLPPTAAGLVVSEKTLYVAYALRTHFRMEA